uniref:FYVE-type domain-containing protein n=1 Tax=Globisporangium ultimum (strain ATCC 200006 / CBS 805.95 / DAOM BR144) TaxID=431595 RepID=K3W559_GLOUD
MPIKSSTPKWKKFHCPPLSPARMTQITQEANVACDELLKFSAGEVFGTGSANHDDDDGAQHIPEELKWEFAEQVDSIRVEKVRVRSSEKQKKSVFYFRGLTHMEASLDEVVELYEVDMEHPNVQLESKLSPDLLHSVILYEIKPYDFHDSTMFIGIRWSAMRSPYVLVRNRDYCFLEIQRRFTLPDGRRGFARCFHSVKIKSCPDMEKTHGFVRGSIYRSGFVFTENPRDRRTLDVVQATYADLKGNVPKWVSTAGLRQRVMNLEHLKKYVNMRRVANQTFARRSQMMAPEKVKTCFVCVDDIGTFQRRYNCQKCGEVICGRCRVTIQADIAVVGKMKLTICSLCSLAINRTILPDSGGSSGSRSADGHRPFSVMPVMMYTNRQSSESEDVTASQRKRALSLNSFHTANFDQTSLFSSNRSHEV